MPQKPTPIQQRLLDFSTSIATDSPDDLAFTHSVLCQTSLPAARPPDDVRVWEKQQGRARLSLEAGRVNDPKTNRYVDLGLPYGSKARLLLMHLNSEAIRRQSPIIPVEDSMTAFFRRVMGSTQDGRQVRMLKQQLAALAAAQFRFSISDSDRAFQLNTQVVNAFELWLNKDESQRVLWPSTLKLSLDYFESLAKFAVPLDERAISALSHSAVALDVYCWLAQRLHRIPTGKPQFVPWPALYEQFGQGYARLRRFRDFFLNVLPQVSSVYPAARFEVDGRGMMLHQSQPPVLKRLSVVRAIGGSS
jgi:hypothetical protein